MATTNLLYVSSIRLKNGLDILIPTVGEIVSDEDNYYDILSLLTSMPIDLMVQLDDMGIDFTEISEYDLFLLIFAAIQNRDTSLFFGDLDLTRFELAVSKQNGEVVLIDDKDDIVIDKAIQWELAGYLRKIHHLEKNTKKPGNNEEKQYMIERARTKQKRNRNRKKDSTLESLIVAMVNTPEFKYDFDDVRDLSIYQFNESVRQVIKKVDYGNMMHGVYSGTINPKELSQDALNWLVHK